MLDHFNTIALNEIKENDRQVDVAETITGLNKAGFVLAKIAKESNEDDRSMAIDGLEAIISAITYVSLMHSTIESIKDLEGGICD